MSPSPVYVLAVRSRSCKLYAVISYVDGGCAQSALKTRYMDGLPPVLLKSFAWQLCLALRYLHKQKVRQARTLAGQQITCCCSFGLSFGCGSAGMGTMRRTQGVLLRHKFLLCAQHMRRRFPIYKMVFLCAYLLAFGSNS